MKATIVDLRYKTKKILQALERNEAVTILYHGQEKAIITPIDQPDSIAVVDHPFFGMKSKTLETVSETMEALRASRY